MMLKKMRWLPFKKTSKPPPVAEGGRLPGTRPRHPRQRQIALLLSILLHLLLILGSDRVREKMDALWPDTADLVPAPEPEPLVFRIVENPLAPRDAPPPERPDFASDRNSEARDMASKDLPESSLPNAEGVLADAYELVPGAGAGNDLPSPLQKAEQPAPEEGEATEAEPEAAERPVTDIASLYSRREPFTRESLVRKPAMEPMTEGASSQALLDNRNYAAEDMGGLTLSTYNWEFGPYLLYLKQQIQRHIYPPAAFTRMGMIEGETTLQFTIHPDGIMTGLYVLESDGHMSLRETSVLAVKTAADFKPLPTDFPEDSLVVTGQFRYTIIRGR